MRLYKIIKYCRVCGKKFFAATERFNQLYCEECFRKYRKENTSV